MGVYGWRMCLYVFVRVCARVCACVCVRTCVGGGGRKCFSCKTKGGLWIKSFSQISITAVRDNRSIVCSGRNRVISPFLLCIKNRFYCLLQHWFALVLTQSESRMGRVSILHPFGCVSSTSSATV